MKYLVWPKNKPLIHCESGIARTTEIYHIKRNMPMTELMIFTEGTLHVKHLEDYAVSEGEAFFMPQNVLHYGTKPSTFVIHWFHFILPDLTILEEKDVTEETYIGNFVMPMRSRPSDMRNVLNLCYQLEQYVLTPETQDVRNALMTAIICDLAITRNQLKYRSLPEHNRLNSIINFILSNPQTDLSVKSLAEKFGYNEKYIFNLFKERLGISPRQYVIRYKMNIAKNMLLSSNDTVEAIALMLSYDNPQYFMRLFKKTFNMTPSELRKSYSRSLQLYLTPESPN